MTYFGGPDDLGAEPMSDEVRRVADGVLPEGRVRKFVGGPLDGRDIKVADHVTAVTVPDEATMLAIHPTHRYHRTHRGEAVVFEWHEDAWVSPAVAAIREAVTEASDRRRR